VPRARVRIVLLVLLALTACPARRPPRDGDDLDRARLIRDGDRIEGEITARGLFFDDVTLGRYLDGVAARVAPRGIGVRTRVVRTTELNAFALPNGAIHVTTGLLAHMDDEAQLAHVLAHEAVHLARDDVLVALRRRAGRRLAAQVAGVVLAPTVLADPAITSLYASSAAGYGREREEEADREALRLVAAAGYPLASIPRLFDAMAALEPPALREASAYRDHPAPADRAATLRTLIAGAPPAAHADADTDEYVRAYRRATAAARLENVRLHLDDGDFHAALLEAEAGLARDPGAAALQLYAGDAHRSLVENDQAGDDARELDAAAAAYVRTLALDPSLAAAHRGLGLVARARDDDATARRELRTYLRAGGAVADRRWIESLLAEAPE